VIGFLSMARCFLAMVVLFFILRIYQRYLSPVVVDFGRETLEVVVVCVLLFFAPLLTGLFSRNTDK